MSRFFHCRISYLNVRALVSESRSASARADDSGLDGEGVRRAYRFIHDGRLNRFRCFTVFLFRLLLFRRTILGVFAFLLAVLNDLILDLIDRAYRYFLGLLYRVFVAGFHFCGEFLRAIFVGFTSALVIVTVEFKIVIPVQSIDIVIALIVVEYSSDVYYANDVCVRAFLVCSVTFFLLYDVVIGQIFEGLVISLASFFSGDVLRRFALFLALLVFLFSLFPFFFLQFLFQANELVRYDRVGLACCVGFQFGFDEAGFGCVIFFFFLGKYYFKYFFFRLFRLKYLFFHLFGFELFLLFRG